MSPDAKRNIIIVAAVGGVALWYFVANARQRERAPGQVVASVAIGAMGDEVIVHEVVDHVHDDDAFLFRLKVDVPGGGTRASVLLDERRACGPASAGKIWCTYKHLSERVELRDAKTLAVVADDNRWIVAMRSDLGAATPEIDLATGELHVHTVAGASLVLDPVSVRARPAPEGAQPTKTFGLNHSNPRSLSKADAR